MEFSNKACLSNVVLNYDKCSLLKPKQRRTYSTRILLTARLYSSECTVGIWRPCSWKPDEANTYKTFDNLASAKAEQNIRTDKTVIFHTNMSLEGHKTIWEHRRQHFKYFV